MSKVYFGKKHQWVKTDNKNQFAEGGNGIVFPVTCNELDGQYVCKELKESRRRDKIRKQRFLNEIKTIANIRDSELMEHIIPIVDEGGENNYWYVMPKAQCLQELLEAKQLDFLTRIHYCIELGKVIKRMHSISEPIAHRDIKPENIFIYKGNVCLADFGIEWDWANNIDTPDNTAIAASKTGPPWAMPFQWTDAAVELYLAIDVYEYVKTVWLILTMENVSYKELYSVDNPRVYLTLERIHADNTYNIFYLHELMTFANADTYTKMKSIDDCLQQLELFLHVNFSRDPAALENANIEQAVFEIIDEPDVKEYKDTEIIVKILIKISEYCLLRLPVKYAISNICIVNASIKPISDEETSIISINSELGTIINFKPKCLRIHNGDAKTIEIETEKMTDNFNLGTKLSELVIMPGMPITDEEIVIDETCIMRLIPKT